MKTPKKLTAFVLMTALSASTVAAVPASAKTFSDVPSNHWAYTVIDEISNEGIMVGTGTNVFSPGTNLTRAEYTAILYRLANSKDNGSLHEAQLNDVESDAWYADIAEWGVTNGIIREVDGNFLPNEPLTREVMADMTYRLIRMDYRDYLDMDNAESVYADEDAISDQYKSVVNILTANGILGGRGDNKFEPKGNLTRAEAAAMTSRVMEVAEKAGAQDPSDNPSEEPEQPVQPENPSDEPEQPSEPSNPSTPSEDPEQPSEEPEQPSTPADDPNDPSNWNLDGAPSWFLVGKTDGFTDEQWKELIAYWANKDKPSDYPSMIPNSVTTEEQAKAYFGSKQERLYDLMMESKEYELLAVNTNNLSDEEMNHFLLMNEERKKAGVPELKLSDILCNGAEIRGEEANSKWSHTRPNGLSTTSVLIDLGLNDYVSTSLGGNANKNYINLGENLTYNTGGLTAEEAITNFMNSKGHRDTLLNKKYSYVGIAKFSDGDKDVWVEIFA